jgi:hypothetical protein
MYSVYFKKDFAKRFHPSSFVLRYSAARCLIQAILAGSPIIKKTVPFLCSFILGFKGYNRWMSLSAVVAGLLRRSNNGCEGRIGHYGEVGSLHQFDLD